MINRKVYETIVNDNIDWKLINYLVDVATEWEDNDCLVRFTIVALHLSAENYYNNHIDIMRYRNGEFNIALVEAYKREEIIKKIENNGLYILISIKGNGNYRLRSYYNELRKKFKKTEVIARVPTSILIAPDEMHTEADPVMIIGYCGK